MANKTRQKLYFATILNLGHQRTPLTTRWVAHFWKQTFEVVFRTVLWMPIANHCEAGRVDSNWTKYPRQDQWSKCLSPTLLHPRQTRKGAQCFFLFLFIYRSRLYWLQYKYLKLQYFYYKMYCTMSHNCDHYIVLLFAVLQGLFSNEFAQFSCW